MGSTRKCLRRAERAPPRLIPGGGHLIGALRFLFPPRWLSQRERAARVLTAEPQVTMHAAGCRRLPSLAVLQKRGWVSAHNQQQPDHICCCSSSSARRVWPRDSMSHESSRMSDSDGSEPTTARRQTRSSQTIPIPIPVFSWFDRGSFHFSPSEFKLQEGSDRTFFRLGTTSCRQHTPL